jgi:hypothetical protein
MPSGHGNAGLVPFDGRHGCVVMGVRDGYGKIHGVVKNPLSHQHARDNSKEGPLPQKYEGNERGEHDGGDKPRQAGEAASSEGVDRGSAGNTDKSEDQ